MMIIMQLFYLIEEITLIIVNVWHKDKKYSNVNLYNYICDTIQLENNDVLLPIEER